VNAVKNLKKLAVSSTVTACGEEGSGLGLAVRVKPVSVKQESNVVST
jgi:putative transposase